MRRPRGGERTEERGKRGGREEGEERRQQDGKKAATTEKTTFVICKTGNGQWGTENRGCRRDHHGFESVDVLHAVDRTTCSEACGGVYCKNSKR